MSAYGYSEVMPESGDWEEPKNITELPGCVARFPEVGVVLDELAAVMTPEAAEALVDYYRSQVMASEIASSYGPAYMANEVNSEALRVKRALASAQYVLELTSKNSSDEYRAPGEL